MEQFSSNDGTLEESNGFGVNRLGKQNKKLQCLNE